MEFDYIKQGDCLELMKDIPDKSVDMILCDLPYGTTAQSLNTKLYKAKIRECIALVEAQATKQNIFSYAPRSNATADYKALVDEILKGE